MNKKPLNAFFLYRTEKKSDILAVNPHATGSQISKYASKLWSGEPIETRIFWQRKANINERACINIFGLGSSGNQIIDEFLKSKGDQFLWIPYNCFQDINYLSEGGFGTVYKATWNQIEVVLKSLHNSDNMNIYFLKE
ncbi:44137_t:CDS:2, partial [Gigaspora margarita]